MQAPLMALDHFTSVGPPQHHVGPDLFCHDDTLCMGYSLFSTNRCPEGGV